MKITKQEMKILKNNFGIYEDNEFYELEQWTNGGVDMIIDIWKDKNENITEQLEEYLENFDIDEEIDLYRQDKHYRDNFRITESVKDFESWVKFIENIIKELKECE